MAQILDLSTQIERPYVKLETPDGVVEAELLHPDELTLVQRQLVVSKSTSIQKKMEKDNLSAREQAELPQMLNDLMGIITPEGSALVDVKLTDGQKMKVFTAFTGLFQDKEAE